MGFWGCSNDEGSQVSSNKVSNIDESPYISSGMQEIINKLDTANEALPINQIIPGFEKALVRDLQTKSSKNLTRSATQSTNGSSVVYGYNTDDIRLFSNKKVQLSESVSSLLNESLGTSTYLLSKTVYISCWVVTRYLPFSSKQAAVIGAHNSDDDMGFNPDRFTSNLSDTTSLPKGFHMDEKVSGSLYYLTTYILELDINQGVPQMFAPFTDNDLDGAASRLCWRYFAYSE